MDNFWLAMIYGCFGILSLFIAGYWGVIIKQVIPTMLFAVIGLILLAMSGKANPFKEDE